MQPPHWRYHASMCSHYQALKEQERLRRAFLVEPPANMGKTDMWPGYTGTFIRSRPQAAPAREALPGLFGLVPPWSPDTQITQYTYNARSETVASKPSFREAWKQSQHCIIPVEAIFEPDWRSGRPVPTRIARADGEPMGIAGLWSAWKSPKGEMVHSFTLLTLNAAQHPLMRLFHKPLDEKRMVVILHEDHYDDWLNAAPERSQPWLRAHPAPTLIASAALGPQATLF